MTVLSFVIPVRHPENAPDWCGLQTRLNETIRSISGQTHSDWEAIIVANEDAQLPEIPSHRWSVVRVDFPPNTVYDLNKCDREESYEAVRLDKGRRVLAGALQAQGAYIMVVDDDDFVSNRLAEFVAQNIGAPGWRFDYGFRWSEGSSLLYKENSFSTSCGTSHIVRRDLFELPRKFGDASDDYVRKMLGSHRFIDRFCRENGMSLQPLPFSGAVYRVGHRGAHSKSENVLRSRILNSRNVIRPHRLLQHMSRIRMVNRSIRREFGLA